MEESIEKTKGLKGLFTGCESGLLYEVEFANMNPIEGGLALDMISNPKPLLLNREKCNFELPFGEGKISGQCFVVGWHVEDNRLDLKLVGEPVFSHPKVTGVVDSEPSVQFAK